MTLPTRALPIPLLLLLLTAPASAREPDAGPGLSVLEPAGAACEWVRLRPLAPERQVLARLEAGCQGGATALSRDGRTGAVRFWRGGVSAPATGRPTFPEPFPSPAFRDRLFLVAMDTAQVTELPLPPEAGELIEFGFDAGGQLLGLTLKKPTPEQERRGGVELEGRFLALEPEGGRSALLAQAFVWKDGAWARREAKATSELTGPRVLALRQDLGERSSRTLDPRFTPQELEDAVLDQLYPSSPEEPEGEWARLRAGGLSLAVWGIPFGEDLLATGLVRRVNKQRVLPLPDFPLRPNDLAGIQGQGAFLLLSLADSGGHPHLYRAGKLVWKSETARAATFWPRDASPAMRP